MYRYAAMVRETHCIIHYNIHVYIGSRYIQQQTSSRVCVCTRVCAVVCASDTSHSAVFKTPFQYIIYTVCIPIINMIYLMFYNNIEIGTFHGDHDKTVRNSNRINRYYYTQAYTHIIMVVLRRTPQTIEYRSLPLSCGY